MKSRSLVFSWLLLATPAALYAQFDYLVTNQTVTITGYTGTNLVVAVPTTIDGLAVTSIGVDAFSWTSISGVTIPESVTNIGDGAFLQCSSLADVTIPNSVTDIGADTFFGCVSLTGVTIPKSVRSIGEAAFGWCYSLTSVTIPNGVTSIGEGAFQDCHLANVTLGYGVTSIGDEAFAGCWLTSATIPNSVTSIGESAFAGCSLTSVTIPSSVTNIGRFAFGNCLNLTNITVDPLNPAYASVDGVLFNRTLTTLVEYPSGKSGSYTIPNTVANIANAAFCGGVRFVADVGGWTAFGCALTSITIPNSVTNIGELAFAGCNLTNVTFGSGLTSIGDYAFAQCGLTSVALPNSVSDIGADAFFECSSLTDVTIPNGVTSIGESAFALCFSLTSVTIPNSVTNIGRFAFVKCPSLTNIIVTPLNSAYASVDGVLFNRAQTTLVEYPGGKPGTYNIPNTVVNIASGAFCAYDPSKPVNGWMTLGCAVTEVTIADSVANIGEFAFAGCRGLTNVTFGSGLTNLRDYVFAGCSLTSIMIPDSVTSIGEGAFEGCSLTSVTIPNSVRDIGADAFLGCNLTAVTIPSSVTRIEDGAFSYCSSLTSLYFRGNAPSLVGTNVFYQVDNLTVYYLPGTVGWGPTFAGFPTALWNLPYPVILTSTPSFGVQTNQFGFTVSWAKNLNVVVEAATDLVNPIWFPVQTNTLTSGSFYFRDPKWKNYRNRFYRVRSP